MANKNKRQYVRETPENMKAVSDSIKGKKDGDTWIPPENKTKIRILPKTEEGVSFIRKAFFHRVEVNGEYKQVTCPAREKGSTCLICKKSKELYKGDKEDKEEGSKIYARPNYLVNMIDRSSPEDGVQVFKFGKKIGAVVMQAFEEPDEDDEDLGDVLDPDEGKDLLIVRTGNRLDTDYAGTRWITKASKVDFDYADLHDLNAFVEERLPSLEMQRNIINGFVEEPKEGEDEPEATDTPEEGEDEPEATDTPEEGEEGESLADDIKKQIAALREKQKKLGKK